MNEEPSFTQFWLLQKSNLIEIQNDLAKLRGMIFHERAVSSQTAKELGVLIHGYANAIRDYKELSTLSEMPTHQAENIRTDLMIAFKSIANMPGSPYITHYLNLTPSPTSPTDSLRDFLKAYLPTGLTYTRFEKEAHFDGFNAHGRPTTVSPFVDKLASFVIPFAGGASLVVPILIVTLHQTKTKSLVTVSIAVTLFAAAMSLVIRASNVETLATTATYVAVMVFFVGRARREIGRSTFR